MIFKQVLNSSAMIALRYNAVATIYRVCGNELSALALADEK